MDALVPHLPHLRWSTRDLFLYGPYGDTEALRNLWMRATLKEYERAHELASRRQAHDHLLQMPERLLLPKPGVSRRWRPTHVVRERRRSVSPLPPLPSSQYATRFVPSRDVRMTVRVFYSAPRPVSKGAHQNTLRDVFRVVPGA